MFCWMIAILMKSSFLVGGEDWENDVAYLVLYYSGFGIHFYLRDESDEVPEEELAGYLR